MKKETAKKAAPKKVEPIELTKAVLLAAAKDINEADIADPPINTKGATEAQLIKALKAAAEIIEPEDPLTPETFEVLKAVAEMDDDADAEEPDLDAIDTAEAIDVTDDPDFDDEEDKPLEDLTVEELQNKCKAAGIPFKAKKTTKAQLIAALEAHEAAQEEDASEEDEPEPEAKPEKKAGKPAKVIRGSGAERRALEEELIKKGKYTKTEIIEKTVAKFPEISASTVRTELTDGKNPKYNKWPTLVKESEKGILSF